MKEDTRAKIIAHAWKDETFRKKLLTNPRAALKEYGIDIPNNVDLKVIAENPGEAHFILPAAPSNAEKLSRKELESVVAAKYGMSSQSFCPPST